MSSSIVIKEDSKEDEQFNGIKKLLNDKNLNPYNPKDLKYLLSLTMRTDIEMYNFEYLLRYLMKYFNDKNESLFYENFFHSCELGKKSNIKILLENGLNVNYQNDLGETPLHIAIAKNDIELIKILIEYEPDTSLSTDKDGFTAVNYAEILGNKKIIKMVKDLDEKNRKKLIKSEIIDYINRDMNNINNNLSSENISNLVNKDSNFEEIQNYNGERMSVIIEEEQNNSNSMKKSEIKNVNNCNNKIINKNDNTITKKILNLSDYNEGLSPRNTIKVINYYSNINNIKNINNINSQHNLNNKFENSHKIFFTEENTSDVKMPKYLSTELKFCMSPLKRKDELANYYNSSINPSCVQSLTTTHTLNKEQIESPLLQYKTAKSIDRKAEIYKFILEINLPKNYAEHLIDNGFDDLEMLITQAKNGVALSNQNLKDIGISLPGDRAKILIHLEELAGNYPFLLDRAKIYSSKIEEKENSSLYEFLSSINLDEYIKTFIDRGYYNAELLYIQMISKNPITEDILKNDFGISKIGHNKRIMLNLLTCSEYYIKKLKNRNSNNKEINLIKIEGSHFRNSCDSACVII